MRNRNNITLTDEENVIFNTQRYIILQHEVYTQDIYYGYNNCYFIPYIKRSYGRKNKTDTAKLNFLIGTRIQIHQQSWLEFGQSTHTTRSCDFYILKYLINKRFLASISGLESNTHKNFAISPRKELTKELDFKWTCLSRRSIGYIAN